MLETLNFIQQLDQIPNAPYLPEAISAKVIELLGQNETLQIAEDSLAVYAHYRKGNPEFKVVIDSHLDHPAFVMRNQSEGVALGSMAVGSEIDFLNDHLPYPVAVYNQSGLLVAQADIAHIRRENGRGIAILEGNNLSSVSINSQAMLAIESNLQGERLQLRSADNLAVTATALDIAAWLNTERPVADVTFVFPKMEEVRQGAATLIAKRNSTPFGVFDPQTLIVVLEAGLMGETHETRLITSVTTDYQGGPVIRIGDNELVFMTADKPNLAESALLHSAQSASLRVQHGPSISNCDATSYTLFANTPHIVGITVPCLFKHNMDPLRGFVPEQISKKDLEQTYYAVQGVIAFAQEQILVHPDSIVNGNRAFPGNEQRRLSEKRKIWSATAKWAEPRLQIGHLFPEGLVEQTRMGIGSLRARFDIGN